MTATRLLYLFAFCSGFAALTYQVAWSRMLSLTFGSSALAVSAVVAAFMGGMGIGAWLYHRVGDRVASPLRAYAWLELAIAASTALLTWIQLQLPLYFADMASFVPAGSAMTLFRIVNVFLLLLIPAALMGATYPALCRALIHSARDVEHRLGWIYGLNTLGAAFGALGAGAFAIEWVGATGSVTLANAINVAIGLGTFRLARRATAAGAVSETALEAESLQSDLPGWLPGLVLFGSGFATLGYEIVWFRALHYLLGQGTYVLSAILLIFLLGLGFGGFLYRPALRLGKPGRVLGFAQLLIAILALCAIAAEHAILTTPALAQHLSAFSPTVVDLPWLRRLAVGVGVALAIMLPATLFMGLCFPLASRLFLGSLDRLTARLGLGYLLSNLGSILGAIGAALVILPALGSVRGTILLACVNVALGLVVLLREPELRTRGLALGLSAAVLALALTLPPRLAFRPPDLGAIAPRSNLAFEEESELGTVQVYERPDVADARGMAIDGTFIAATEAWLPLVHAKQILLAHLPLALDRDIRHTLTLGFASGSSLETLGRYPWVESLDAVEINRSVVNASGRFEESAVLEDPRAELFVEDALHYMLASGKRYDLIVSDAKENPRFGGTAKVLSSEFYRYSLDSLSERGLFVQFATTLHERGAFEMILRTFLSVFPEAEFFLLPPGVVLMVGSRLPIAGRDRPDPEALRSAGVTEEIERRFVGDAELLPSLWVASGSEIRAAVGDGPMNDWNRLPLEFASYRARFLTPPERAQNIRLMIAPERLKQKDPSGFTTREAFELQHEINLARIALLEGDLARAGRLLREVLREAPEHPLALQAWRIVQSKQRRQRTAPR